MNFSLYYMTTPGVTYPTVSGMTGSSARNSAIDMQTSGANKLTALQQIGGDTVVPQFSTSYSQQNGSQGPNQQIINLTNAGTQQNANSVYDKGAMTKGGRRRKKTKKTKRRRKTKTKKRKYK